MWVMIISERHYLILYNQYLLKASRRPVKINKEDVEEEYLFKILINSLRELLKLKPS
jgi:hypothetical protein